MICKNCGNKLTNGTFCIRCGTENSEVIDCQEVIPDKKETDSSKFLRICGKWILFVIIIGIIVFIMNMMFDSCVAQNGHNECGLGTLCDSECMPPFYVTLHAVFIISLFITIMASPGVLIIYLYDRYKKEKSINIENK